MHIFATASCVTTAGSACSHSAVPKRQLFSTKTRHTHTHTHTFCCNGQQSGSPKVVRLLESNQSVLDGSSLRALESLCRQTKKTKQNTKPTTTNKQRCVVKRAQVNCREGGEHCRLRPFYRVEKCLAPCCRPLAGCLLGRFFRSFKKIERYAKMVRHSTWPH